MPLHTQSEVGEERRRSVRRPLLIGVALLATMAVAAGAVCLSPVPLDLGKVILAGPISCVRLDFRMAQYSHGEPPARHEVSLVSATGTTYGPLWINQFHIRWPFVVLVK